MALLLAAVRVLLLLLGLPGVSQCLCLPTAFYQNCWIQRFPGLLVDLRESQRRGAQLLKGYAEISPQQCSRTCCLLRNGIDPDLLIFEKLKSQEPNAYFSASKSERQHSTKTSEEGRCRHHNATTSGSPLLRAPPAATSHGIPANTPTPSWSLTVQRTGDTAYSRAEASPAATAFAKRTSSRSVTSSDKSAHLALSPKPAQVLSHVPTPPHLNSSKQHLNETKGYSGRNSTSDNETATWEAAALGVWLIPVVFCSSLLCLCCCTVALTAGRCSYRRGHYKPVKTRTTMSRQLTKYAPVRGRNIHSQLPLSEAFVRNLMQINA
ncbi:MANSC domain-containing protein 4 [Lonchura striata]|uniref:MANSC domain-containing protein 4 n=1 Tax=Lonchura striata TaxID=40157 RepID=A0A218V993_9PASE|nr:MANSC domain-containing protein 4 [Lonchura striata domestica]